jgi:hypothetical protein
VIVAFRAPVAGRGSILSPMAGRRYRLVVAGELSDDAGRVFEGMTLTRDAGNTLLVGVVRDQAQLHGLFQRVSDLGLTLLSAAAIDEPGRLTR